MLEVLAQIPNRLVFGVVSVLSYFPELCYIAGSVTHTRSFEDTTSFTHHVAVFKKGQGLDGRADPKDEKNVENIRTHHIAHGNFHVFSICRHGGRGQFRQGCAYRYNGQPDEGLAHTEFHGDIRGAGNDPVAPDDQSEKS